MAKLVGVHTTTDLSQDPSEKLHSLPPRRTTTAPGACCTQHAYNLHMWPHAKSDLINQRRMAKSAQVRTTEDQSRAPTWKLHTRAPLTHPGFTLSASLCFKGLVTSPCWDRGIRIYFFGLVPDNSSELKTKSYFANFQGLGTWFPGPYRSPVRTKAYSSSFVKRPVLKTV